jgi:two-component system chemotaxis sensor kinase CheA
MDAILPVTDILQDMFENVRAGVDPVPADPELLTLIGSFAQPDTGGTQPAEPVAESEPAPAEQTQPESSSADEGDITDEEFEAILDASQGTTPPVKEQKTETPASVASDEITDDEFDALLDDLHGEGQFSGVPDAEKAPPQKPTQPAASQSDEISDDEFDALLDNLHGEGKFSGVPDAEKTPPQKPATNQSDEISEDEFEALLDDLHGTGGAPTSAAASSAKPKAPAKPAPKKETKKPEKAKEVPQAEATVRVDTKRLDDIMNMVGELVLVRNRLSRLKVNDVEDDMSVAIGNLDVVTTDLQISVMKTRMQPVKKVFGRFPRVVRDLARSLKKEVNLELAGEDTDLDKNLVEAIADPLVHLVRNAVDHGIETPDEREKKGKSRLGTVLLSAEQEGDHILLTIEDDGAGMDADVLRKIAVDKGLMDKEAAARLDDNACFNLIFAPGFSTKEVISDVSGRGVGMDVVKSRIAQLNGSVEIESQLGKGSRFLIKLPLTLAIMPTLMVVLGNQTFALPLTSVNEIFDMDITKTNVVDGQEVVIVRGKALPLFYLRKWLVNGSAPETELESAHVVIVSIGSQHVGFVVDQLLGQEEVVIKPLGAMLHGTKGVAGATVTGDGKIALILDVPEMLQAYAGRY